MYKKASAASWSYLFKTMSFFFGVYVCPWGESVKPVSNRHVSHPLLNHTLLIFSVLQITAVSVTRQHNLFYTECQIKSCVHDRFYSSVPEVSEAMEVPTRTLTLGHCGFHCVTISFCWNSSLTGKREEVMRHRGLRRLRPIH